MSNAVQCSQYTSFTVVELDHCNPRADCWPAGKFRYGDCGRLIVPEGVSQRRKSSLRQRIDKREENRYDQVRVAGLSR